MTYSRVPSMLYRIVLIAALPLIAAGCGGGGGSAGYSADARTGGQGDRRSVSLHNYHNYWLIAMPVVEGDQARLEEGLRLLAKRDSICYNEAYEYVNILKGWSGLSPQSLKVLNPRARVYRLYNLSCKNNWDSDWNNPGNTTSLQTPVTKAAIDKNDWWLRDGNGNIVKENDQTWFLDPGKPGFKEAYLDGVLSRLAGKGFDGVLFDYWHPSIDSPWFLVSGGYFSTHPMPTAYSTDDDWYLKAWKPFVEYVMMGVRGAGYRIIGNGAGEYMSGLRACEFQRTLVDGAVYEQEALDWQGNGSVWLPGNVIEQRINAIASDPLEVWVAEQGLRSDTPEFARKQAVSLAMYYVAIPSGQTNRTYHNAYSRPIHWESLWDFYIGEPSEPAAKLSGNYFWSRKYTQGLVLLNYESAASVTFTLDTVYRDPSGREYAGQVTLQAHTALILAAKNP